MNLAGMFKSVKTIFNTEDMMLKYTYKKQLVFTIASVFLFLAASGQAPAREIIDMTGCVVTIPDEINKVYAASPPETMLVYAIDPSLLAGLNFPFKGCDQYIAAQTLNLPVIGGYFGQGKTPNLEKLVALHPDIVIGRKTKPVNKKFESFLEKFNIPIVYIARDKLQQYPSAFEVLGDILNKEARARKLAEYTRATLSQTAKKTTAIPREKRLKVYYAEGNDGLRTEGSDSFHARIIPLAGGINAHGKGVLTRYGKEKVTIETVIAYQPDVIFVEQPSFYERIYTSAAWKNIPAVKNHRVHLIPKTPFNWFDRPPSFMRLLGLKWAANILYPDIFDWDMPQECREFFRLFLQKDISVEEAEHLLSGTK